MTTRSFTESLNYCLTAHLYYLRMLKSSFNAYNEAMVNKAEQEFITLQQQLQAQAKKSPEEIAALKPKIPDPVLLPVYSQDWIGFKIPTELRDFFKNTDTKKTISYRTIQRPEYSIFFLDHIVGRLMHEGFYILCIPVLLILQIVAEDILKTENYSQLVNLKFAYLYEKLNCNTLCHEYLKAAGSFDIPEHTLRKVEEAQLMQKGREQIIVKKEPASREKPVQNLLFKEQLIVKFQLRNIWIQQAQLLIGN
jgi:hypothetical protein